MGIDKMTRIYKTCNGTYSVQEKYLFWWTDKMAKNDNGDLLPCTLTGFDTLEEALKEAQTTPVYIHENCLK